MKKINKIITLCKNCGNEIKHLPSVKRLFCSQKCKGEWMSKQKGENCYAWQGGKIKINCEYCNKFYYIFPCEKKKVNFCSKICYDKWQSINKTGENSPSYGYHHTNKNKKIMSEKKIELWKNNPEVYDNRRKNQIGGQDLVKHHYIYDHNDLTKYTTLMTRSKHNQIHCYLRKLKIKIPHLNR